MTVISLASALVTAVAAQAATPAGEVNPLIGTANGGNTFPGAVVPFGMVQFSPEESPDPAKSKPIAAPGGYEHHLDRIRGFSLTNVSGWGCAGGSGDVPITPVTTAVTTSPSSDFRRAYASTFSHADEQARAGVYRVKLENGVAVALTASTHTGAARFTFPAGDASLLIRVSDSEVGSEAARVRVDARRRTVSGQVTSGNFCGYIDPVDRRSYYTLHFVAVFDQPIASYGVWRDLAVTPGGTASEGGTGYGPKGFPEAGHGSGAWVGFDPRRSGGVVNVRIGVSYVDDAGARANLAAEEPKGTRFEQIAARAQAAWDRRLGQVEVTGGEPAQRTVFYTALYHSLLHPNVFSDVDGRYAGFDGRAHRVEAGQGAQYANFSGWDVYRSLLPLQTWLDPQYGSDVAQSLYNQARQNGGDWDRWTHQNGATHVMNGDPSAPALAGIWAFGGHGFDTRGALASLVAAADRPTLADLSYAGCPVECAGQRPGLDAWLKLHFIPVGAPQWGGAADTLETSAAEFGVSSLAARLGEAATAGRFLERARYWRNLYDPHAAPDGGYVRTRQADGAWALVRVKGEDDTGPPGAFTPGTGDGFVEGTAAQYVWMVPFDAAGLFDAMGGVEAARRRLDGFFYTADGAMAVTKGGPLHAELDNEPSIGAPWLYDYVGAPWKTQELVRRVLDTLWVDAPRGIPGNDDLGAMSGWAVWAALGLYPEVPGRAELVLGSPWFPKVVVHRPMGDVVVAAKGGGPGRPYVQALKLDGIPVSQPWLPESFALHGGRLDFSLGAAPNLPWGAAPSARPPSFGTK